MKKLFAVVASFAVMLFLWMELAVAHLSLASIPIPAVVLMVVAFAMIVMYLSGSSRKALTFFEHNGKHYRRKFDLWRSGLTAPFAFGSGGDRRPAMIVRHAF
jgi:hypothetical protein